MPCDNVRPASPPRTHLRERLGLRVDTRSAEEILALRKGRHRMLTQFVHFTVTALPTFILLSVSRAKHTPIIL